MKRTQCSILASLFAVVGTVCSSAQASPLIAFEDFESAVPKDAPLSSLNTLVGTFTPTPGFNVFVSSPGYTNYGPGLNPTTSSILTANGDESFDWTFAFGAAEVWLEIYLNDLGPATLSFYGAGSNLLAGFVYADDSDSTNNLVSLHYDAGANVITNATFVSTNGGISNTGLDNITIAQRGDSVPEPSSLALVLAGLGLGALRARRRAQAGKARDAS